MNKYFYMIRSKGNRRTEIQRIRQSQAQQVCLVSFGTELDKKIEETRKESRNPK